MISGVHVTVLAGVLLFLLRMCALPELPALGRDGRGGVALRAGLGLIRAGGARGGRIQRCS